MATGRGFQGFEEKLDTGASWPDRMIRLSSLGPGARRTLGESDQGAVSPQTGRRHLTLRKRQAQMPWRWRGRVRG